MDHAKYSPLMAGKDKREGLKHVGADIPEEKARRFSDQCDARGFIQRRLFENWIDDWLETPEIIQMELYHRRAAKASAFEEEVQRVLQQLGVLPPENADVRSAKKKRGD